MITNFFFTVFGLEPKITEEKDGITRIISDRYPTRGYLAVSMEWRYFLWRVPTLPQKSESSHLHRCIQSRLGGSHRVLEETDRRSVEPTERRWHKPLRNESSSVSAECMGNLMPRTGSPRGVVAYLNYCCMCCRSPTKRPWQYNNPEQGRSQATDWQAQDVFGHAICESRGMARPTQGSRKDPGHNKPRIKTSCPSREKPHFNPLVLRLHAWILWSGPVRDEGYSVAVASQISLIVRKSTTFVSQTKWVIFCRWCKPRVVQPTRIKPPELVIFWCSKKRGGGNEVPYSQGIRRSYLLWSLNRKLILTRMRSRLLWRASNNRIWRHGMLSPYGTFPQSWMPLGSPHSNC